MYRARTLAADGGTSVERAGAALSNYGDIGQPPPTFGGQPPAPGFAAAAPPPPPPSPSARPPAKPWKWIIGSFVVGLLLGVGIGGASSDSTDKNAGEVRTDEGAEPSDAEQSASERADPTTTERTTTTERATTTTERTTTTEAPSIGTRDNPVPVGVPVPAGDWDLTVTGYEPGAGQIVANANQFNTAASGGSQYVRVKVKASYTGEGTGSPFSLRLNLADSNGATYSEASVASGSGADPMVFGDQPETFNGGSVEGFFYFIIPDDQAGGDGLLAFPPNITYTDVDGGVGFFRVK